MTQKSNEEIYKALKEEERTLSEKSVGWLNKAFKLKENHAAIGRSDGNVTFCDGGYSTALEGLQVFVFEDGKQITAYNWKIEDAKKGKFDLIITREVSRFARNTVDTLSYIRELKAVGVNLFFINDGINTATDYGELRLTIMSSLAQDESRKISERVKAGQEISREKHVLYGNGNILGYRRENGTYVPDPDQAQTVKLIYQMYSTGKVGLQKVAAELYRLGRLDASGHVSWDASKVSRVLHNATYKGCIE